MAPRETFFRQIRTRRSDIIEDAKNRLGIVTLTPPGVVVAGSVGQWTLRLEVGSYGIDEGGTIKIAQRFASDWETPQFDRPAAAGFTTVTTTGDAKLAARYDRKGHVRPWMRCIVIDVYDGCLSPGDVVEVVLGDQREGSPGIRAQSFQESAHEIRVLVDPTNACLVQPVAQSPVFPIVPGELDSLVCILPSDGSVGDTVEAFVRGRDVWGNPTPVPEQADLVWDGPASCVQTVGHALRLLAPGSGRIVATAAGRVTVSNPLQVHDRTPALRRYWGDLHAQTDATVGTGSEAEYFTYGRDQARLDFTSHQGNDFQMTDQDWQRLNDVVRQFHQDDVFVVFPGYEWSANSPAGGDRNVFYRHEGLPIIRSSHWQIPETAETQLTPAHPADTFFDRLRAQIPSEQVLVASHVGGRYADIRRYFDQQLAPLVEVVSCWGIFEWMLWDAFEKGHRVGVMCNSDGHKGRPGDEGPGAGEFGIGSGLTCVLAESLTRDAVFQALRRRHCYGTTGPRMLLDFHVDGQLMGSEIQASNTISVAATVDGTTGIESIELFQADECILREQPKAFSSCHAEPRVRVMWGGSRIRGRGRRATWDGQIQVTGNEIIKATPIAFDSPADGIVHQNETCVDFRSRTTGDYDGIELVLGHASAGSIAWKTPLGELQSSMDRLDAAGISADLGGLDLRASIRRYPDPSTLPRQLRLATQWRPIPGRTTPLFVKATQADGHQAWASPVYVTSPSS